MDHPFSMLWDSGTVRLKYICMEDFRLNKFCGEHLLIGPEKQPVDDFTKPNERKGEPVAEARIQTDQSFHHLKILKSGENNDALGSVGSSAANENDKKRRKNQRVYSQDFRILKILPSNADDTSDIGKIGNEIYFKKDENEIEDSRMPFPTVHEPFTEVVTHAELDENNEAENDILQNENSNWNKYRTLSTSIETMLSPPSRPTERTTTTTITTTSVTSPITYETVYTHKQPNSREENLNENETIQEDIDTFNKDISNEIILKNESSQTHPPLFTDKVNKGNLAIDRRPIEHDQRVISTPPTSYHNKIYKENSVIKSNDILDETKVVYDDEVDYSYEDFAVEYNGRTVFRQNIIRNHTSHQTSFFRQPLLQGFLATTGYPKFYIGESNCSWRISAPIGQRVRITILDINLRYDFMCKDFIQIFDLEIGRTLFNSCSEYARPIQVLSDSNHIMISVNTTSKVAYPKRGVLLHYTALGCLTPSAPLHGRLVHKSENSAKYICDPTFVFPDTAVSSRELICTSSHTWDKVLPNCIEKSSVHKSGIITVSQFNHKKHKVTMAEKDDLMNNIIIPSSVIAILFIVNALVFLAIMRCRQRKRSLEFDHELAQL
ncbi:hypothetical protein HA402_000754 [Bradysia odoriphaga]|nr:hypothetical protein HA402_000754 [Bradysia odoriphaga]